jgi:dihydrofolate synthase/folylpolyglutamate synthase
MKRSYAETVDFLYAQLPVFQRDGAAAYKPGLETILSFCEAIGNPHLKFKSIHIGGTNGKGSTSHTIASIVQEQGYKTGLYTSPHLFDFRERIRINGEKIPENEVVTNTENWKHLIKKFKPSFFELTVALAFHHFANHEVDIAIIEVGMGGRLDSTNIVSPLISIITNIGLDHQAFLGETHELIAGEKAGIIKAKTPVIVSERQNHSDFAFAQKAKIELSNLEFASDSFTIEDLGITQGKRTIKVFDKSTLKETDLILSLTGNYQLKNIKGILAACKTLNNIGWQIEENSIKNGVSNVQKNTGLMGRWQTLQVNPLIICDTGHNEDGIKEIVSQLKSFSCKTLWLIWGMVGDKDHSKIISLLPKDAKVIATQPILPRALDSQKMSSLFIEAGFDTIEKKSVAESIEYALQIADNEDLIFIGGSTFTVADIPIEKFLSSN